MYNNPESILDSNYFYSTIGVVSSDSSLSIKYCNFDDVYGGNQKYIKKKKRKTYLSII